MQSQQGSVDLNGTRLDYSIAGRGAPLVFIHGLTLDRRMWNDQVPFFAEHFSVLNYDMRGFGASAPPQTGVPYSHAGDLHALLTHLGIARTSVVGLSMGGRVGLEFALSFPNALKALVLVDSAVYGYLFSPKFAATLNSLFTLGREGRLAEAKAGWLADPLFAYSAAIPGVSDRLAQMVTEYRSWGMLNDDPHQPLDPPPTRRLAEISAPTLVVVGEHDIPDFHAIADILATTIPGARKLVLGSAGHMANMDAPAAFNAAVLDFLRTAAPNLVRRAE